MKGPADKNFEGIYANPRFMHAAGIIVGCVVHVQVKSGSLYEGVLRTFSSKADFVLEMARKLDSKKIPPPGAFSNTAFSSIKSTDEVLEKIVFKFEDVIMMTASNVDPDFATRDTFTDSAISRSNGQILERELEPWDAGTISTDGLPDLGGSEEANGWDANDMFRTNEEKYGVKSSFDSNLPGYTIPLNKQNTEEYKQQEAKATQIAQEIESGPRHKARSSLDNGDEEYKYSAVIRPDSSNNNNNSFTRVTSMKNKRSPNMFRNYRGNPSPGPHHGNRNSHQHSQVQVYQRVSSPAVTVNNSQGNYKMVNSPSGQICVSNMTPRPTPTSTPTSRSPAVPLSQMPQYHQGNLANSTGNMSTPPNATVPKEAESVKVNGDADKTELKFSPKPPRTLNLQSAACKEGNAVVSSQITNKSIERRKEVEKKAMGQKNRDEKTEDLKRFYVQFKLADEKDVREDKDSVPKSDVQSSASSPPLVPQSNKEKHKEEDRKSESRSDSVSSPDTPKSSSTLNPNAKEFVFNPNAKSFTPRAVALPNAMVPPPVQPQRLHTQSPIMAVPQSHLMPGLAQTVFNVAPHYVVSTTPLSVPVAPPFNPASIAQAPRLRKNPDYGLGMGLNQYEDVIFSAMPMTLQRHDMSQPMHVQAATGQPILAQPTLSAPQFTIQYAPSPGVIHHPPGPPQQLAYAQMYSLMPRVLAPHQTVGMVPTSAAYGDNPQIQTHIYMPHQGTPGMQHAMNSANAGQHSAPSTPQSQTPNLHPAPSPVHQQPQGQGHGQPQTPNGIPGNATPQQMVYHSHMAAQHQLHGGHTPSNQGHPFAGSYAGTPQPIVLLPQQSHHGPHPVNFASTLQNHLHGQNPGSHSGTPTHILAHPSMAMIPTSAAMVHTTPTAMNGGHYVPHSQV